jgi:cytochrome c oxidase assembly factor CtaG
MVMSLRRPSIVPAASAIAWVAASAALSAHEGHPLASAAATRWTWEPYTIVLIALSAALYGAGVRAVWRRAGIGRGVSTWQVAAFAAGLASLVVALLSPVAWLSSILFSVHMTQHEILMLVTAPLLVVSQPIFAMFWALPRGSRVAWAGFTDRRSVATAWHALTGPLAVFVLHAAAIWIWHAPALYEAALANDGIHALEHLSFVITASLFWWGMVHGRYGRIGYGVAVVYVFLTAVHSSVLGALMTVAPGVWYPAYASAGTAWHVDALADQQLAGLLMWVPSGVVFIVFGLGLFAAWLGESERRVALGRTAAARGAVGPIGGRHDAA